MSQDHPTTAPRVRIFWDGEGVTVSTPSGTAVYSDAEWQEIATWAVLDAGWRESIAKRVSHVWYEHGVKEARRALERALEQLPASVTGWGSYVTEMPEQAAAQSVLEPEDQEP